MRTYTQGTQYEFIVNYFYTTTDDEGRERCWLSLSDGEGARKYNVPAYPYQKTGFDGKTILCKVTKVLDNGYPYLLQNKADVLKECYNAGETYWFSVLEKKVDPYSGRPYFRLLDRLNDIEHRFYCSEQDELKGLVGFDVRSISGDHLDLAVSGAKAADEPEVNPFGHEDDTHEWKSSLVYHAGDKDQDNPDVAAQVRVIMKSIAGLQNAGGGLLYLGVTDNGEVCGIEKDYPHLSDDGDPATYSQNPDGFECKVRAAVHHFLGKTSLDNISFKFYRQISTRHTFCVVTVKKTARPVFVDSKDVFKRFGNGFRPLKGDEITQLVCDKLGDQEPQAEFTMPMPTDCYELNPNQDVELLSVPGNDVVVKLNKDVYKKMDFYYMTFFSTGEFMYSKESHASEENVIDEVRFNRFNGNMEYSRDLLVKCTSDGHAQFLPAFEMCKLGEPDTRIKVGKCDFTAMRVAHKYDFLKVIFTDSEGIEYEKYIRVQNVFGDDTEKNLKSNSYDPKYEFKLKGNSMIPSGMTLKDVKVIHETLPDEIQFVSARTGSMGRGSVVGSQTIDVATY